MLVKKLDKLSTKNNEIFIKAYFKVLVTAMPFLLAVFAGHLSEELNDQNDLL